MRSSRPRIFPASTAFSETGGLVPLAGVWGGRVVGGIPSTPRPLAGVSLAFLASSSVQSSRHSKLEKADILEMTVKHLRNLQRAQMTGKDCLQRVPLCGRPSRRAVISSRLPPVVVRGIQLHFTALAHSYVPTVWGIFIATTPSCYCSGKGGRVVAAARAAGGLAVRKAGGGERT